MKIEVLRRGGGRIELLIRAEGAISDREEYQRELRIFERLAGGVVVSADYGNALLIRVREAKDDAPSLVTVHLPEDLET